MQDSNTKQYTVLIADDDANFRFLVKKALHQSGYVVHETNDGEEAIELLHHQPVDIILLDISMPKLDGLQTCRKIREKEGGIPIPIVIITGVDDVDAIQDSFDAGATDFISKPINWLIFEDRIRFIIRANHEQLVFLQEEATSKDILDHLSDLPDGLDMTEPVDKHVLWNLRLLEKETGSSFISQLVKSYLNEMPELLEQIKSGSKPIPKKTAQEIIIRIKTKSEILGAKLMVVVAREFEHSIVSGNYPNTKELPEQFLQAFELTKTALFQTAQDFITDKETEPFD